MRLDRERLKRTAARALRSVGTTQALLALQKRRLSPAFVRCVNYHGTPTESLASLDRHFAYFRRHFRGVGLADLEALLSGRWPHDRPGILISFDDGLRSNVEAVPLLESHGFTGWFFVPTGFVDVPVAEQDAFADAHRIDNRRGRYADGRVALSWDEVRSLDRNHIVGCHTHSHYRLVAGSPPETLEREIGSAKALLERQLGHPVPTFCWVGGEEETYSRAAAESLRSAGFRYAFGTCSAPTVRGTDRFLLHRTHLEADWPLELVEFQLCGIADWFNASKRARVAATVSGVSASSL